MTSLRDRWNRMTLDEKRLVQPSGRACVDCGEPAGTPWGPYWCPECDDKRIARIDAGMQTIAQRFAKSKPPVEADGSIERALVNYKEALGGAYPGVDHLVASAFAELRALRAGSKAQITQGE